MRVVFVECARKARRLFAAATTVAGTWNRAAGFSVLRTNEICQCLVVRIEFYLKKLLKPPRNKKLICAGKFFID